MKTVCLALCVVAASAAFTELTLDSKFENFKADFGKKYATAVEESAAKAAFVANDAIINEHENAANSDVPFETSNKNLTCTSKEEFEAVFKPKPNKKYPGFGNLLGSYSAVDHSVRELVRLVVFLSAAGCLQSGRDDIQGVLKNMEKLGVSLELTEEDRVREAMVLLMMAHPGLSKAIKKLQKHLDAEKKRRRVVSLSWMMPRPRRTAMTSWQPSMMYRLSRSTFDLE